MEHRKDGAKEVGGLTAIIAKRADEDLYNEIWNAINEVLESPAMKFKGRENWVVFEGQTYDALYDGNPLEKGHTIEVEPDIYLRKLADVLYEHAKERNRELAYNSFMRKFDDLQRTVQDIQDRQDEQEDR